MSKNKGIGTWFFDNENEFEESYTEFFNNPDFSYIGGFDTIQDIIEELEYQGFTEKEISQFTLNQYGTCLEILETPNQQYQAFIGNR